MAMICSLVRGVSTKLCLLLHVLNICQNQVLLRCSLVLVDRHLVKKILLIIRPLSLLNFSWVSEQVLIALVIKSGSFYLHLIDFVNQNRLIRCELIVIVCKLMLETAFVFI